MTQPAKPRSGLLRFDLRYKVNTIFIIDNNSNNELLYQLIHVSGFITNKEKSDGSRYESRQKKVNIVLPHVYN